jgi:hypothetical protein
MGEEGGILEVFVDLGESGSKPSPVSSWLGDLESRGWLQTATIADLDCEPEIGYFGNHILDIRSSSYSPFASVLMGDPEDLAVENFAASEYDHCLLRKLYVAEILNRSYEHILQTLLHKRISLYEFFVAVNHENGGVNNGAGAGRPAHIYIYIPISIDLSHMLNVQHRELSQISLS